LTIINPLESLADIPIVAFERITMDLQGPKGVMIKQQIKTSGWIPYDKHEILPFGKLT
jgi:hypothetical protein